MPKGFKNRGVLIGQRPVDWVAGISSQIPYEVRLESGDWRPFVPPGETQRGIEDYMDCVTRSATNACEIQLRALFNDEIDLCDRAIAKLSNTTKQGNWLWAVADAMRLWMFSPEYIWPDLPNGTWDEQFCTIPPEVMALLEQERIKSSQKYDLRTEFLPDTNPETLKYHLKQSPIQVVIPGHAVVSILNNDDADKYFDSYKPYIKSHTGLYQQAMKYVVTPKNKPMTEQEVKALQALEGYDDPAGAAYWAGKPLGEYLKARLPDKVAELQDALDELP